MLAVGLGSAVGVIQPHAITNCRRKFASGLSLRFRSLEHMHIRDNTDAELRLLVAVRQSIRERGGQPSSCSVDELPDERAAGHVG